MGAHTRLFMVETIVEWMGSTEFFHPSYICPVFTQLPGHTRSPTTFITSSQIPNHILWPSVSPFSGLRYERFTSSRIRERRVLMATIPRQSEKLKRMRFPSIAAIPGYIYITHKSVLFQKRPYSL